jgi:hypothetical protein
MVNLIKQNILLDNDNRYCSQGLETHTIKGRIQMKQNRAKARDAVLDQHDLRGLQAGSIIDEQKIAEVYRGNTHESRIAAYIKGVADTATIHAMDHAVQEIAARTKTMEPHLGHCMPGTLSRLEYLRSRKRR